ncbi:hypothetical protein [Microbacterium pygmaeum]|uniref:hypothetical protein n=1 Tax=Microbacterium pygmaeum TaxID=370764 RepID=UPI0012F72995|nr:hypothetical protein [Microbacterium pygmaeum]
MSIDDTYVNKLLQSLNPSGSRVDSYVYSGHEACARVLNPAHDALGRAVKWRDIAPAQFDPRSDIQWADLGVDLYDGVVEPAMGSPDATMSAELLQCLGSWQTHTLVSAQWIGYADVELGGGPDEITFPPGRASSLRAVTSDDLVRRRRIPMRWFHPQIEWVVGNDIYGRSLFVSGSLDAVGAIVTSPSLEAYRVDFRDPVSAEDW